MEELENLARLLITRNQIDALISSMINRPAINGHIGEYIAGKIFDIKLNDNARDKGTDGVFNTGSLATKSVNIKLYGKQEGLLDVNLNALPDYYLVMTGPKSPAISSRGKHRPCVIDHVYLFKSDDLKEKFGIKKFGVATSIKNAFWEKAEIYPKAQNQYLSLSEDKKDLLKMFGEKKVSELLSKEQVG